MDERICSADGCKKPARTRGMCYGHYARVTIAGYTKPCAVDGCERFTSDVGTYCPQHRQQRSRYGKIDLEPIKPKKVVKRFVDDAIADRPRSACWLDWPYMQLEGRPMMYHYGLGPYEERNGNSIPVARYVVFVETGVWPVYACHRCPDGDDQRCWNPDHLYAGDPTSNIDDMRRQQRGVFAKRRTPDPS